MSDKIKDTWVVCPDCGGDGGHDSDRGWEICPTCEGVGELPRWLLRQIQEKRQKQQEEAHD